MNNSSNNTSSSNFLIDEKGKTRVLVNDKAVKIKKFQVKDPYHAPSVGDLVCQITPPGNLLSPSGSQITGKTNTDAMNECLLSMRVNKFEFSGVSSPLELFDSSLHHSSAIASSSNPSTTPTNHIKQIKKQINPKMKNKLRYICIIRSTNHLLIKKRKNDGVFIKKKKRRLRRKDKDGKDTGMDSAKGASAELDESDWSEEDSDESYDDETSEDEEEDDDENDDDSNDGYDTLYNPEDEDDETTAHKSHRSTTTSNTNGSKKSMKSSRSKRSTKSSKSGKILSTEFLGEEASSFPLLICLALQSDGSNPDIRKVVELEHLVGIESVLNKGMVQLVFQTGEVLEIDCDLGMEDHGPAGLGSGPGPIVNSALEKQNRLKKERFLWSLLQIHAILCTSVVERILSKAGAGAGRNEDDGTLDTGTSGGKAYSTSTSLAARPTIASLPPLTMRNVDRAELQYISTVNGFLSDSPVLQALLERQRIFSTKEKQLLEEDDVVSTGNVVKSRQDGNVEERKESNIDDMDDIAYDMIMGNFTRLTLFLNEKEKQDAEDVMNSLTWQQEEKGEEIKKPTNEAKTATPTVDEIATAEALSQLLQKRMRNLEAETCRRLIAWEDEKYYSATGIVPKRRDTMEAMSLSTLFQTLDQLDNELDTMEEWLSEKASAIKPLTVSIDIVWARIV